MVEEALREDYERWHMAGVRPAALVLDVSTYVALLHEVAVDSLGLLVRHRAMDGNLTFMGVPLYIIPGEAEVQTFLASDVTGAQTMTWRVQ
jgi:hypothetical protein